MHLANGHRRLSGTGVGEGGNSQRPRGRRGFSPLAIVAAVLLAAPATALSATYYVDNTSPSCSNSGPGTQGIPYCTISGALTARPGPGNTFLVKPGTYREQVSVPSSGSPTNPIVIQATAPGVVVDGADSFENAAQWTQVPGTNVWLAASVNWPPVQVFGDGQRLVPTTVAPESLPARTFRYDAGIGLYVNAGGGNPSTHGTLVGRRANGFRLTGRSNVTVSGFTVTRTEDKAIYLSSSANNCTISNNFTTWSGKYGIQAATCNGVRINGNVSTDNADHGIALTAGSSGCTVEDNESARNAHPTLRQSNGLYLYGAPGNLIQRNRIHDNQDTGIHIQSGSNNNVCLMNVSWNNGDHGFDHLIATGTSHVGDVAYGNFKDGFSIEGSSKYTNLQNCIAINNGLTSNEFNLWIDAASDTGLVSDYNLFWNSNSQPPIKWKNAAGIYSTIAAFTAASGHDPHSIQANPLFVAPAGGDFRTQAGSPAIDSGNSGVANWPSTDMFGNPRVDDPMVANTGVGPILYGDRGAVERQAPPDQLPVITAPATMPGIENALVTVNVSVNDPDGQAITSLSADLTGLPAGHGAVFTPGPGNTTGVLTWTPTFAMAGNYNVTFTATNTTIGQTVTQIQIANVDRAPVVTVAASPSVVEGQPIVLPVTVSDPDGDAVASLVADLSRLPHAGNPSFTPAGDHLSGTFQWTPPVGWTRTLPFLAIFTATNTVSASATSEIHVLPLVNLPPVVTAPDFIEGDEGTLVTVNVTAIDPEGDPIGSLTADLSGLPVGNNAVFTVNADKTAGVLTWTPTFGDSGLYPLRFTATNSDGPWNHPTSASVRVQSTTVTLEAGTQLPGTHTRRTPADEPIADHPEGSVLTGLLVRHVDRPPVVVSPAAAAGAEGGAISFHVSAADPDGDAIGSLSADLTGLPGALFTPDAGDTSGTFAWTPGYSDSGTYVVVFTAANLAEGRDTTTITVTAVDRAPVVNAPAVVNGTEGTPVSFAVTAVDPDGNPITSFTADLGALPPGATFGPDPGNQNAAFQWTPGATDAGNYTLIFTATNALVASDTTSLTIASSDQPPVVNAPDAVQGAEGSLITFTINASDLDGGPIVSFTAALDSVPAGALFTADLGDTTGTFAWTPGYSDSGTYRVVFIAANLAEGRDTTTITVAPVDRAPVVDAPAAEVGTEGAPVSFTVSAADPDGNPITSFTASLDSLPAGATFVPDPGNQTATLQWTPGATDAGTYTVIFTALNALAACDTTTLTISTSDQPPVVNTPAAVQGTEGALESDTTLVTVLEPGAGNAAAAGTQDAARVGREASPGAKLPTPFAASIHPNPIRGQGHLTLSLPRPGNVRVDLFDVTGRHLRTLLERNDARAGVQDISFDVDNGRGAPLRTGLYLYRVTSSQGARSGTLVVMK